MARALKLGPWGGDDGNNQDLGVSSHITLIRVHAGEVVDSIQITYRRDGDVGTHAATIGGRGGEPFPPIQLSEGQYIKAVWGTIVEYRGHRCVSALNFLSNNDIMYGPYGRRTDGNDFSLPSENGKLVGFFGRVGTYINALGVYMTPVD